MTCFSRVTFFEFNVVFQRRLATALLFCSFSMAKGLPLADRIKEQGISGERLRAIVWAEAEENDSPFAHRDFDECGFSSDAAIAKEPA